MPQNSLMSLAMSTARQESLQLVSLAQGAICSAIAHPTSATTAMGSTGAAIGGGG